MFGLSLFGRQYVKVPVEDYEQFIRIHSTVAGLEKKIGEVAAANDALAVRASDAELVRDEKIDQLRDRIARIRDLEKQIGALNVELADQKASLAFAERLRDKYRDRVTVLNDGLQSIMPRIADMTPQEAAQLGFGTLIRTRNDDDGKPVYELKLFDYEDWKDLLMSDNKSKQTEAKFRHVKQHFVEHKRKCKAIIDEIGRALKPGANSPAARKSIKSLANNLETLLVTVDDNNP